MNTYKTHRPGRVVEETFDTQQIARTTKQRNRMKGTKSKLQKVGVFAMMCVNTLPEMEQNFI